MRIARLTVALLCLLAADARAQARPDAPAPATRIVRGVVVSASDDTPLASARINAIRSDSSLARTASVLTDARGEFAMAVPADTALFLRVLKAGYATTSVQIGAGRAGVPTELRVAIAKGAVVTGRVLSETGSPIV